MSERIIVTKWWTPLSKAPAARKTRRTADRYSDNRDPDPHGEPKRGQLSAELGVLLAAGVAGGRRQADRGVEEGGYLQRPGLA